MPWCVHLWVQLLWDSLSFLDFLESIFFTTLAKFSLIICSNKFSISCCSSLSGTPIIQILECFRLSQRFLSLSSFFFFEFLFLHSVLVGCLCLAFVPNHCFESWFHSCHCRFPEYFALLQFRYLSFVFFHFLTELHQFCEHFDYQSFKFSIR